MQTRYLLPRGFSPHIIRNHTVIAIYSAHAAAEAAVIKLQHAAFDMKKLSIIGHEHQTDQQVVGYYNLGDRMKVWGKTGAFWGGMWGILFGSAIFIIPGVGPLLMAGPLISSIVGAVEGAVLVGGLSAIGGGLASWGVPRDSVLRYETALKRGKFMLIAHGTATEAAHAKEILQAGQPDFLALHH